MSAWLIGTYGWRSILVIGGIVPIVFAAATAVVLPESVRYLTLRPERKKALVSILNQMQRGASDVSTVIVTSEHPHVAQGAIREIVAPSYLFTTMTLWAGLFVSLLTVYLLNSWLPIMIRDAGFTIADAALIGAMGQVGGTLGNIVIGWLMDRWEPHKAQIAILAAAAVCAMSIGVTQHGVAMLMTLVFLLGFCVNSANTGWTALATTSYPTNIRATGTGAMTGVGRFGAISGAFIGSIILALGWTFGQIFMFLAVPIMVGIIATMVKSRVSQMPGGPVPATAGQDAPQRAAAAP